jgi:CheY-like chemotaxis protein
MKIEIRCENCSQVLRIDQSAAAGEMPCPMCLSRIDLAAHAPKPEGPASDPAHELPDEVVCPRCNLHFSPFSKRSRSATDTTAPRKTVLVVEDQKYFREVATDALSAAFEVKTVSTAQEARAALDAGGVDLLVLDLTLDGGDSGHGLLSTLKPKPCPIVIFTAQDESELYGDNWERLSDLGADELVIKGMNVGESLRRKVAALLGTPVEELEDCEPIG